jgi:hypothetical protein
MWTPFQTGEPIARGRSLALVIALLGSVVTATAQGPYRDYLDPAYDVLPRATGVLGATPYDLDAHRPPNLLRMRIGRWQSTMGYMNLFEGMFAGNGMFLRVDLEIDGLVNPPGSNDPSGFDPFRYGPNPIYGFIELDADDEIETGGETEAPEFRYLANAARFGGLPSSSGFDDRLARRSMELDGDFNSAPYIERSGEEFHWALLGGQFSDLNVTEEAGNGDLVFETGEIWQIEGDWLHRAHGFEPYSLAFGGLIPGEYLLYSIVRFAHDLISDSTTISLIVPMTNAGASYATGNPPEQAEPHDSDTSNHTSIAEALDDLVQSADLTHIFPSGDPEEVLIIDWHDREWSEFLDPRDWRITALLGTSYTAPGVFFIWTDIYPNVERGDIDGESGACAVDRSRIESFISDHDADDGTVDGTVTLANFAADFDVMDVSYDGVVDDLDILMVSPPGDLDVDDDVDMIDVAGFQACQNLVSGPLECDLSDINRDLHSDFADVCWLFSTISGPAP